MFFEFIIYLLFQKFIYIYHYPFLISDNNILLAIYHIQGKMICLFFQLYYILEKVNLSMQ